GGLLSDLFTHQDLGDLDLRVAVFTQDVDQVRLRALRARDRPAGDADHGRLADVAAAHAGRQRDRSTDPRVVRVEPHAASTAPEHAGHAGVAPLDDLFDAALDAARGTPHHPHTNPVAVHRTPDGFARDIDVVFPDLHHEA